MIRLMNLKIPIGCDSEEWIRHKAEELTGQRVKAVRWRKKSIDARKGREVHYVASVDVECDAEAQLLKKGRLPGGCTVTTAAEHAYQFVKGRKLSRPPVIVGAGPAGLFAGLILAQNGYAPIILERGLDVDRRGQDIRRFWETGALSENSNVQFGEGGAGTFSDGKLTTGIKDYRIGKVLEEFVRHGAPEEILYLAKPHIGTDRLRGAVKGIREEIISLGGAVRFESCLADLYIENGTLRGCRVETPEGGYDLDTEVLMLAAGHSARDTFRMLMRRGIPMERKTFAVGARIEHPARLLSKALYGKYAQQLPAADYKAAVHLSGGRTLYTFCMCPGGTVINASSEAGGLVTNGMSDFARDGANSNSALLVNVFPSDIPGTDVLGGLAFQRELEKKAFASGGGSYRAPAQRVTDFLDGRASVDLADCVSPTFLPGVTPGDLRMCLPAFVTDAMAEGLPLINRQIPGFTGPEALLTGNETRSSSPVKILRDRETHETPVRGLYSAGEGGGHAGGITSAAVDGIKTAEQMVRLL